MTASSLTTAEIATQADCWRRAAALVTADGTADGSSADRAAGRAVDRAGTPVPVTAALPAAGERIAVIGCGTSWFMAQAYASLREQGGHGETDAFAASEFPLGRGYDRVLAITRSGTTTEVLQACARLSGSVPVTAVTADPTTPVMTAADAVVVLDFADEQSVVQTRFATTVLALLRTHLGEDLTAAIADAERAVTEPLPDGLVGAEQFTFLGTGWTYGLAQEAALKMREAAGAWTESYPAMEYRHGPISITGPGRAVWAFGALPEGLADNVDSVGGRLESRPDTDPLADLIRVQRLAVAIAEAKGYDPDRPRNLTRSVILA